MIVTLQVIPWFVKQQIKFIHQLSNNNTEVCKIISIAEGRVPQQQQNSLILRPHALMRKRVWWLLSSCFGCAETAVLILDKPVK